jgi:dTMP kinase
MFITVEGGEGAGKTTQIKVIREWLAARGHDVVATREPGGTALAEGIRRLVTDDRHNVPPLSELLLLFAARVSHVETVIAPALAAGKTVLCDRFTDASHAYQGGGRGLPAEQIDILESWLPESACPDLTILIDVPVELGLTRARRRGETDRFERETVEFFGRVRETYLARARQFPRRFIVIDAGKRAPKKVAAEILARLEERLGEAEV